jgi:hypothetical protein
MRAVLSDRLDIDWQHGFSQRDEVNTLKEAYLSWQPRNDVILDVGRVNQYSGVAIGYNPSDFFRGGALRSPVSVDPTSIKTDRQGSVMLRGQALWEGRSVTALQRHRTQEGRVGGAAPGVAAGLHPLARVCADGAGNADPPWCFFFTPHGRTY